MTPLAEILAGWPMALAMATAVAAQGVRNGRRRSSLNEALHELRRPLQAVALASGPRLASPAADRENSIELASAALERLDREINGGEPAAPAREPIDAYALVQAAIGRWQARARLAEGSLEMRWNAGKAAVEGDRVALSQALDNLIVNAIEHGGPTIVVAVRRRASKLRIVVVDSGLARRPRSRRGRVGVVARLAGRKRHGHGLAVVRRVASAHGGRFAFSRAATGSLAVIELPLAGDAHGVVA